jgi:hypothetical protein
MRAGREQKFCHWFFATLNLLKSRGAQCRSNPIHFATRRLRLLPGMLRPKYLTNFLMLGF